MSTPEVWLANTKTEAGAPVDEREALNQLFSEAGYEVSFDDDYYRLSADVLPWVVIISISGGFLNFLRAFTSRTGELAAEDAWPVLKELVARIVAARNGDENGQVQMEDWATEAQMDFHPSMSDAAYQRLLELDWSKAGGGRLGWDAEREDWYDLDGKPVPERDAQS